VKIPKQSAGKLANDNQKAVKAWGKTPLEETPYFSMLVMFGDMFDLITKGDNCYAILGATSSRTAFSLTVNISQDKASLYGPSLEDLGTGAQDWL